MATPENTPAPAIPDDLLRSILAPILQPQANLQSTQQSVINAQAQNPGIQATSGSDVANLAYTQAPQNLAKDLKGGMSLSNAMSKYTGLKMSPDDIFTQYRTNNPSAVDQLDPTQLGAMSVTNKVLGAVGDTGTIQDRWNTSQAVQGLRKLQDIYNKIHGYSKTGIPSALSQEYDSQRTYVGNHLSSLVPGAPAGQGPAAEFLNTIPDSKNLAQLEPGAAAGKFYGAEQGLVNVKGYKYSDLGLQPPTDPLSSNQTNQPASGGDLLSNLTKLAGNTGNDLKGLVTGVGNEAGRVIDADMKGGPYAGLGQGLTDMLSGGINEYGHALGVVDQNGNVAKNGNEILGNMLNHAQNHPVNTLLDVLPLAGALKGASAAGGVSEGAEGASAAGSAGETGAGASAGNILKGAPNKLSTMINPTKANNVIGQIRDNLVSTAAKDPQNVVTGDNFAKNFEASAEQAKLANPANADAIDAAIEKTKNNYAGKNLSPQDLKNIYDRVQNPYTAGGQLRTSEESVIDNLTKDTLNKQLQQMVPGWNDANALFQKSYSSLKDSNAKAFRGIPGKILTGAAYTTGYTALKHIFPWL